MPPVLTVLARNRDFRLLFFSELILFGGDWFVMIPLLTLLPDLTGSGLWGGLVLTADMALLALLLPYTGTVADRVDRRRVMIVANLAAIVAVAALLLVRSSGTAWIAVVAVGCFAVAKAFYSPAASAALPNTVAPEDLATANALSGSAWGTMLVVGASLGGVVSAAVGPYVCFGVTVACLLASALAVWRVRGPLQAIVPVLEDAVSASDRYGVHDTAPPPGGKAPDGAWPALVEATRYIRSNPRVASLVTVKSAVGLGNGVLVAFPLLATSVFRIGELGTGLLFAARGAGALIGPLLFRWVLKRRDLLLPALAVSMSLYGLAYLGVSATTWFWLALILVTIAHLAGGANWVMSNFALQEEVPDALRGRVFATDMMIATLAVAVSQLIAGVFVDHVSPRVVVAVCALVTVAYAVFWRLLTLRVMRT
ncbi:MFS transporter [Virgisporangium aurantiacum]|uniref:MFS transporter n=1 Tax=Virgisporangium aurantiacum TaxID=175570 RepID=A0A8J3Z0R7_9ACTN|nr:MFS transporter [Virgisporangium aurantiacum]GIJ53205.1 MFS transporter [Virgisporangium aurantiacum]